MCSDFFDAQLFNFFTATIQKPNFVGAAAEHRARRRWIHDADFHNNESDATPVITDNLTNEYADDNDMTSLIQLPHSMKIQWNRLRPKLAELPPSRFWPVMKTLSGGWATSYRMHVQPVLRGCVLGCNALLHPDTMSHYMVCKRLWHHAAQPRGQLHRCVLARLGLHETNFDMNGATDDQVDHVITRLAVAYRFYHSIKDYDIIDNVYLSHKNYIMAARLALRLAPSAHGGR